MINPQDVEESLKESTPVESLPEAPMSIHIDTYYKGFHSGISIRMSDNSVIPTKRIMTVIDSLILNGFQPSWNPETNNAHSSPQKVTGSQPVTPQLGSCPQCGSPLIEAKKKDGTSYIKCSTNKWDKFKKVATGCDYVDWGE